MEMRRKASLRVLMMNFCKGWDLVLSCSRLSVISHVQLNQLKTDLRDVLYSHKWTPDAYLLARAYIADDTEPLTFSLPRIPLKHTSKKLWVRIMFHVCVALVYVIPHWASLFFIKKADSASILPRKIAYTFPDVAVESPICTSPRCSMLNFSFQLQTFGSTGFSLCLRLKGILAQNLPFRFLVCNSAL